MLYLILALVYILCSGALVFELGQRNTKLGRVFNRQLRLFPVTFFSYRWLMARLRLWRPRISDQAHAGCLECEAIIFSYDVRYLPLLFICAIQLDPFGAPARETPSSQTPTTEYANSLLE